MIKKLVIGAGTGIYSLVWHTKKEYGKRGRNYGSGGRRNADAPEGRLERRFLHFY